MFSKPMTVADLIAFLQTQPQEMLIAYRIYSEYCLLQIEDITLKELSVHREDNWVHSKRPDQPHTTYLVFPGN